MKYRRPRGTHDIVPPESHVWAAVEGVFADVLERYGYAWIRTPIIEPTELFVRAVGEESDIVTKEMYTFEDRGGRSITLRPENTASVIRAYLENGLHRRGGVQRLCYAGPMFRYDRPQAGRYRQFHQVGAEAIGSDAPALDAEMIAMVVEALGRLGFRGVDVRLNSVGGAGSRGPYRRILREAIDARADRLAPGVRERYADNPLRIFDAKDVDAAFKRQLPVISDHLVDDDREHFARVRDALDALGVSYAHDPHLVRGLDYYTRTVFEIYHEDTGAQSALCGGGRYDGLVEECGGPPTPAIGFSAGLERIVDALPDDSPARQAGAPSPLAVVCCDADGAARALALAAGLRARGIVIADLSMRSLRKQARAAEQAGARFVVAVAGATGEVTVRDVRAREEETMEAAAVARWIAARGERGETVA